MYTVAVRRDFIARHALVGGDWGPENEPHAHHYVVEARLYGKSLDRHGYLLDICEVETRLDQLVEYYRNKTLNSLPEFKDLNPSIELFARILCRALQKAINGDNLTALSIKIWENEAAWAEYRKDF
ncbi:MAG: 6-carboxytetrahydropterin synthase [Deltaproteobacteria bacterium]|nr:6-carboxytetrahydropterin synthase [Deltaproteobacteria bacterium]